MIILTLILLNAALGFIIFNTAWKRNHRYREVDEERDRHYPVWRREDASKWSYWRMLPFALTIFGPRLILWIVSLLFILIVHSILLIGVDPS